MTTGASPRWPRCSAKTEDAELFAKRAENYRNLFDPSVGFMRGKKADGTWHEPFDPREVQFEDYTEATSWNYTWFVPQNVPGLIELMGGDEKFIAKLDLMFAEESGVLTNIPDLTGLIGQYVHGNEPCHHVAYLYNDAGAPWKTQERVRNIMTTLYNNQVGRNLRQRRLRPDLGLVRAERAGLLSRQSGLGRLCDRQPDGR